MTGLADVATQTGRPLPIWDSRLYAASMDLALVVPDDARLPYRAIEFALHHHGIIEPTPHLLVIWLARRDPAGLSEFVSERLRNVLAAHAYARMAVGIAARDNGRTAIVISLQHSFIETEPIPKAVGTNGKIDLRGRILPPYAAPEVLVTRDSGVVEPNRVRARGDGAFSSTVACKKRRGVLQIEVAATGPDGAGVLANFPVYCGTTPPQQVVLAPPGGGAAADASELERRLVDRINEERRLAGLSPLAVDPEVAAVARAYSKEMAASGNVAHVSPTSGTADDRLRRAGVRRPLVQENLARAATVNEAHDSLMRSPGHRANILSPDTTHIGVGIESIDQAGTVDLFVTELFTRIPPAIDRAEAGERVTTVLRKARRLRVDADLAHVASTHAELLASGMSKNEAATAALKSLSRVRAKYGQVRTVVVAVADVGQVRPSALPKSLGTTHFGVGVAQGPHPELGDGTIYVVVIFGRRA